LTYDLLLRLRDINYKISLFLKRNLAYFGAYIAHVGMLVGIVGFLGNYRGIDKVATLNAGDSTTIYTYDITFTGMEIVQVDNATNYQALLKVVHNGKTYDVKPARSKYPTASDLHHEIGLHSGVWHDLYVTLSDFDKASGNRVTLEIHINPTVRFVWTATVIMVLGGLIALFDRYRGNRSRDAIRADRFLEAL
jgi:cytochrome c-type biogenesis protein CcmF